MAALTSCEKILLYQSVRLVVRSIVTILNNLVLFPHGNES